MRKQEYLDLYRDAAQKHAEASATGTGNRLYYQGRLDALESVITRKFKVDAETLQEIRKEARRNGA